MKKKATISLICGIAVFGLGIGWLGSSHYHAAKENNGNTALNMSASVANLNLDQMIELSDLIISGAVSEVTDYEIMNQNPYKSKCVSVNVTESFKGNKYQNDTVIIEMTSYEEVNGVHVAGELANPDFAVEDNVTLFLVANDHGSYYVASINQGVFYIDETAKSSDTVYKHRQHIGNNVERFTRSELLDRLSGD